MAKQANYSNNQKYSNRKSFDENQIPVGKVLVPFCTNQYDFKEGECIPDNFTTMHLGEFKYEIGFMPIYAELFESYMTGFWKQLNDDMKQKREGRCIIGKNPDGTNKLCPFTRHCTGCPENGFHERCNPYRIEILSLDYEYNGENFDIADESQPSVEDQVLKEICPEPTEEELQIQLLAHLDKVNPRYAQIIRLKLQGMSIDKICVEINLKSSRGRQEINNAHDAVCEYLRLRHHKKNRK